MRIFFHGNNSNTEERARYAGFILPVTIAAIMVCTCVYCACFALVSAQAKLLQKQTAEWNVELDTHNAETNAKFGEFFGALYAAD
jgi:hypothetical protein